MKLLYLLRHAKSSWKEPALGDFERPLKSRGLEACMVMAEYMRRRGIAPDLVLCSTARRARDTLEFISRDLGRELAVRYRDALYVASAERILAEVRATSDDVGSLMVVGHNPGLAQLAHDLVASGDPAALRALTGKFPTAALASLEVAGASWADVAPGCARLAAFVTPKGLA